MEKCEFCEYPHPSLHPSHLSTPPNSFHKVHQPYVVTLTSLTA